MLWMASQWAHDAMITSLWRRLTSYWRYHWVMCPLGWWWYLDDQWFRVEWNVLCCCSDNVLYPCYKLKLFKYPFACHFRGSGYVMQPSSILLKSFCQLCAKRWWLLHVIEANQILMNVDIQVINKLMPTLIRMIMFITFCPISPVVLILRQSSFQRRGVGRWAISGGACVCCWHPARTVHDNRNDLAPPRNWQFKLSCRFEFWQAPRRQTAAEIWTTLDKHLARRLTAWWIDAQMAHMAGNGLHTSEHMQ